MLFYLFVAADGIAVLTFGLVLFGIVNHAERRSIAGPSRLSGVFIAASGIVIGSVVVFYLMPLWTSPADPVAWQYAGPLFGGGVVAVVLVTAVFRRPPIPERTGLDLTDVDLMPRRLWSYGRAGWFVTWLVLAAVLIATVVTAGLASSADDKGRFDQVSIAFGDYTRSSTAFPGWYVGIPVLIGLTVLALATAFALARITSTPLRTTGDAARTTRATRGAWTRAVMRLSTGSSAFTLGTLWIFIGRASTLAGQLPATGGGKITVVTPFAALQIPLIIVGLLLCGCGIGMATSTASIRRPVHEPSQIPEPTGHR